MKKRKIIYFIIIFVLFLVYLTIFNKNKSELKCGDAGISLIEFSEINLGDSQFEVNNIIDPNEKYLDEEIYNKCVYEISKENNEHMYTYTYKYIGKNGGYALITFTADYTDNSLFVLPTVSKKEQINLK